MENTAKRKRKKRALKRGILITAGVMAFLALCYLVWTGLGAIPLKGEAENTSSAAEPIIPDLTPEPAAAPTRDPPHRRKAPRPAPPTACTPPLYT